MEWPAHPLLVGGWGCVTHNLCFGIIFLLGFMSNGFSVPWLFHGFEWVFTSSRQTKVEKIFGLSLPSRKYSFGCIIWLLF